MSRQETSFAVLMTVLAVLGLGVWAFGPHTRLPRFRVAHMRVRLFLRLHPGRGHATAWELHLRWGRLAVFRRSARIRRSLPIWVRLARPGEHSVTLGRAQHGHRLRVPADEHVLIMAPPRTGKTGLLAAIIQSYPGPVVSTTTKHDVYQLTSGIRAMRGPVLVFNPQNIGNVASTFRWNPVDGCTDAATAIRRADGFANAVSMDGTEEASFWSSTAASWLRALFHAAALARGDMTMVTRWALGSAEEAEDILWQCGANTWAAELGQLRGEAQKTVATVRMVLARALAFMADPALASSVLPGPGAGFDIEEFLAASGTLYLIAEAEHDDSPVAPLFAAMAGEIHHTAAQLGQAMAGGRLDPPLLMALDEIVQTCPVPLPAWLADSGGKGIELIPVAHGDAQLRTRWGKDGAQVISDTCGVKIWLPGITDTATLKMASDLCGQASYTEHTHVRDGAGGTRREARRVWHDILTPGMIRQLPPGRALIIRGSHAPVIARLAAAWNTSQYRRARRHGTATLTLPAQPAQTPAAGRPGLAIVPDPQPDATSPGLPDDPSGTSLPWS